MRKVESREVVSFYCFSNAYVPLVCPLSTTCVCVCARAQQIYPLEQLLSFPAAALPFVHYGWDQREIRLRHWPWRHFYRRVCQAAWWPGESAETVVPGPPELQRCPNWGYPQSFGRGNFIDPLLMASPCLTRIDVSPGNGAGLPSWPARGHLADRLD